MTLSDSFKTFLEADGTLVALLTGGIWDASELGDSWLTPSKTKTAYNAQGVMKPNAVIRWRTWSPQDEASQDGGERGVVEVYVHQAGGSATLLSAQDRLKTLVHRQRIGSGVFTLIHQAEPFFAAEMGGVQQGFSRFHVLRVRS